jgi:hypothetical protein
MNCVTCNAPFERPEEYKEWATDTKYPTLVRFYEDKLKYCDPCEIERVEESLKRLPEILKILADAAEEKQNEIQNR